MNYKDTLLMPKTEFEMRGNLPKKEPAYVQRWQDSAMYEKVVKQNEGKDTFVFHDGPPYANGNMHIGHMMNKVIKDVICRYKNMEGFYTPFIPGWDTHGLPIENAIQKLGVNRKAMTTAEFREKCREYALEQVHKQMEQCIRVGTFADYKHPYLTLMPEFEANQIDVFAKMAMEGLIYKGLKPVYWSPSSESALAEAEVEYHDVKSPTIFVKFAVKDGKGILDNDTSFVIWTTTPWTIPANLAICLNADYTYALVQSEKGKLIVLDELVDSLWEKFGLEEKEVLQRFKGSELEMVTCQHPLYDRESLVILGDHVTAEAGTGCVHTAPGFGMDDFVVGQKYGLDIYCNVDAHGKMMEDCGEWLAGQYVDDANKTVTMKLDELGVLLKLEFITHSYPHDWRTKKPIIFRATDQWFCSIDKIREKLLSEIDKVNWLNEWGHVRIYNMIRDRGDWCISRQRSWGVPIPIIYCEDGTPIMEKEVFEHISHLFREYGSNVWFEKDENFLLPEGYTNEHSPNGIFRKEKDIMDVWFDSGSSHTGVMKERGYPYPVDLYFEGSDQYRGWFNSSLIIGTAAHGCAPYKTVLSHGFVLDGKGNKMSKSLGNTVDPIKMVNQYGADILRLWATSIAYQSDVRISDEIMKQVAENYRKMRNTMRFVLGNLSDFKSCDVVETSKLEGVDQYMLVELNQLVKGYKEALNQYDFSEANQLILNCFTNTLSAFYMDFTKDILYIEKADGLRRRQVQTVLYHYAKTMMKLLSPVLVFTAEELHDHFHCDENKAESVFLEPKPELLNIDNAESIKAYYDRFLMVRKDVMKALEDLRNEKVIKSNMEAKLTICFKDEYEDMAQLVNDLKQLFIVAKVELTDDLTDLVEFDTAYMKAEKFNGIQCPRCWNYYDEDEMEGELCHRCHDVMNG
ncbi:isoleucyl-tRNA synthetase [Coprobacillus cateniformis]|uniref:Isoleucine--tRNA ligase n=2 Tax=Coprobacillus cateniformis TaxID=100884 RepID=E7GC91_9FIRM|nr:isoleucine--tRNA ligase [Coprobacillus cateniformis]EFW04100.1 isoleucyl-tRNA synthetase [Coprobacillus cateniformis]PWM83856.1 MAG: isoleucine--tRNA ligase [Coprobacillus sp.]